MTSPKVILSKNDRRAFDVTAPPDTNITQKCMEKSNPLHGYTESIQGRNNHTVQVPTRNRYLTISKSSLGTDFEKLEKAAKNWKSKRRCVLQVHGNEIRLEPLAFHPDDKKEPWFDAVASKVVNRESKFKWSRDPKDIRIHKAKVVCAITLIAITLRVRGDMQGTATVFAYAPETIASDLRVNKLAEVFGTDMIRYLLEDIFLQIKTSSIAPAPQTLLIAARDLVVAYLERQDHRMLVQKDPEALNMKLSRLFTFLDNIDDREQPTLWLLAIKTSIAYAAIICTAYDMAHENERYHGFFAVADKGVDMVVNAAVGQVPVGVSVDSTDIESIQDITWANTESRLNKHDMASKLINDALASFNHSIIQHANKGYIMMRSQESSLQVNAEDAKEYAITTTGYLRSLMPEDVELV
ncbi:hypothetical protein BGZ80_010210 [Entomortierella chlamydospora]|uniref:Uncharacterized protein n=1 Tax=Entomortierella chlamydospora TaxID=101097 RepID=A0A9P6T0I0_9FUNG|nr:hypothetical protein BGZ80_010210 [Entomortierella chlamydospora]